MRGHAAIVMFAVGMSAWSASFAHDQGPREACVASPVPYPAVLVACLEGGQLSQMGRVALVTALGETGPAREEAREALMTAALVDEAPVHRAMRRALY